MSGYTFDQLPELKKALESGNVTAALDFVPDVSVDDDEYEYVTLLIEIKEILVGYYKADEVLALETMIEVIAKSERIYFTEDWPQFLDLLIVAVGAIADKVDINDIESREKLLSAILAKAPMQDRYVANESALSYNLACYYAMHKDVKTMMEYVRRAAFYFEKEKFLNDACFREYKEESFFLGPLDDIGYTMYTWWTCAWPVKEWYEDGV
ncbi:hypothetical protein [Aquimarina macrocephali]|uniref:hypothetical protein n=1 Tax=Aquimarina macrocephali TaxID=666563 RepID=UPI003F671A21